MRLINPKHKVNKQINAIQTEFDDFIVLNRKKITSFSAAAIRDILLARKNEVDPTVDDYLDTYFAATIERNSNLSPGTKKNYRKAIRHLKAFLAGKALKGLLVKDLTTSIAISFKDYLLNSSLDGCRTCGMTEPSAAGNIMKFKTIFNRAVDEGLLNKNPFKVIRLKHTSPQKPRLSVTQMKTLLDLDLRFFSTA